MNLKRIIREAKEKGLRLTPRYGQFYVTDNTGKRDFISKIFQSLDEVKTFLETQ